MISKETYCRRILNSYSLIVDFDGEPPRENVSAPIANETFSCWKDRIFGPGVTGIVVYSPKTPGGNKTISKLQDEAGAEHLKKVFMKFGQEKNIEKNEAVKIVKEQTIHELEVFPKDLLTDLLDDLGESLEGSTQEFFNNFLQSSDKNINTKELLRKLITTYNNVVKRYREVQKNNL